MDGSFFDWISEENLRDGKNLRDGTVVRPAPTVRAPANRNVPQSGSDLSAGLWNYLSGMEQEFRDGMKQCYSSNRSHTEVPTNTSANCITGYMSHKLHVRDANRVLSLKLKLQRVKKLSGAPSPMRHRPQRESLPSHVVRVQVHGRNDVSNRDIAVDFADADVESRDRQKTLGRSTNYASHSPGQVMLSSEEVRYREDVIRGQFGRAPGDAITTRRVIADESSEDESEEETDAALDIREAYEVLYEQLAKMSVGGVCHTLLSILPLTAGIPLVAGAAGAMGKAGLATTAAVGGLPMLAAPIAMAFCPNPVGLMETAGDVAEAFLPASWCTSHISYLKV